MFHIKQFSQKTGVTPESIRYYERRGILPTTRLQNGYRIYTEADVERLNFIRRARQLDFPLESVAEILALRDGGNIPCEYVQQLLKRKINEVQERIHDLEQLRDELTALDLIGQQTASMPTDGCICRILETNLSP